MKLLIAGFALSNARFVDEKHNIRPGPPPGDDMTKKANRLCKDFFRDFHGVMDPELVTNVEINNGNQGSVSLNYDHLKNSTNGLFEFKLRSIDVHVMTAPMSIQM